MNQPPTQSVPRRILARCLPAPLLSLALMALWLLLARSVSRGQCLIALALGLAIPLWLAPLRPTRVRVRHPLVIARLMGSVGVDALRSNLELLASLTATLLRLRPPPLGRFVVIDLELRDPHALAALAAIAAATPGAVWCELARDARRLRMHVWQLPDGDAEAAFIARFKARYERPLQIIFESPSP